MKRFPKVSIIIPCQKKDSYVLESIKKCLQLDYPNFEIILLPNRKINLSLPKTKVIPTGKKLPAVKRNLGAKHAQGQILAFLDADAYPTPDWLKNALGYFFNQEIAAVCGPGITPDNDSQAQQISGAVYRSILGGANFSYRYAPWKIMEVDDFPSCNFIVRKRDFKKVGGFNTQYWPGEDTILCLDLIKKLKKRLLYDHLILVYHHRRQIFLPHLKQIFNYAVHRGFFVKKFPETSARLTYFLPSSFVVFSILTPFFFSHHRLVPIIYSLILSFYFSLVFFVALRTQISQTKKTPPTVFLFLLALVLTHLTYGLGFIKGLLSFRLKR